MARKPTTSLSIVIDLVDEIEKAIKSRPDLGYSSVTDFARDAMREKLADLKGEVVHMPIDADVYDRLSEIIREAGLPFLSPAQMIQEFLRKQLEKYEERARARGR